MASIYGEIGNGLLMFIVVLPFYQYYYILLPYIGNNHPLTSYLTAPRVPGF